MDGEPMTRCLHASYLLSLSECVSMFNFPRLRCAFSLFPLLAVGDHSKATPRSSKNKAPLLNDQIFLGSQPSIL